MKLRIFNIQIFLPLIRTPHSLSNGDINPLSSKSILPSQFSEGKYSPKENGNAKPIIENQYMEVTANS